MVVSIWRTAGHINRTDDTLEVGVSDAKCGKVLAGEFLYILPKIPYVLFVGSVVRNVRQILHSIRLSCRGRSPFPESDDLVRLPAPSPLPRIPLIVPPASRYLTPL